MSMRNEYPCLEIDLKKLRENIEAMKELCGKHSIEIAGVIKGFNGIERCVREYDEAGLSYLASSRLEQLEKAKKAGMKTPTMCIRIPMISEAERLVACSDCSLESEISVLRAVDKAAGECGKKHEVILMTDLGDLREGFWTTDELVEAALVTENELKNLSLIGIATNLGCYGSIEVTVENMNELIKRAEAIEAKIGRKLKYIGGGATTSLPRILDNTMPERINLLRIGEAIIYSRDLPDFFGCDMSFLHNDAFTLKAEIIEIKTKASHPVGNITVDAFGHKNEYEDRGMRKRALVAAGKVDYCDFHDIYPRDEGVEVIGASSDHTILDIQDAERDLKVGDIVEFDIRYGSGVFLTNSPNVKHVFR